MGYAKLSMRRRLMMVTTSGGAIFVHSIGSQQGHGIIEATTLVRVAW